MWYVTFFYFFKLNKCYWLCKHFFGFNKVRFFRNSYIFFKIRLHGLKFSSKFFNSHEECMKISAKLIIYLKSIPKRLVVNKLFCILDGYNITSVIFFYEYFVIKQSNFWNAEKSVGEFADFIFRNNLVQFSQPFHYCYENKKQLKFSVGAFWHLSTPYLEFQKCQNHFRSEIFSLIRSCSA